MSRTLRSIEGRLASERLRNCRCAVPTEILKDPSCFLLLEFIGFLNGLLRHRGDIGVCMLQLRLAASSGLFHENVANDNGITVDPVNKPPDHPLPGITNA